MGACLSFVRRKCAEGICTFHAPTRSVRPHVQWLVVLFFIKHLPIHHSFISVKSKTPEGCVLVTLLALLEYAGNPAAGMRMLLHCLDRGFIDSTSKPELRLLDRQFLDKNLLVTIIGALVPFLISEQGKPDVIRRFLIFSSDESSNAVISVEVQQSCICGREASYIANKDKVNESNVRTSEGSPVVSPN
jgi:hypothetical protein